MGRTGRPEEVASAVYYLCKDATWTTGQGLAIDGGLTVP
jgi:NAD(P)-dependent dehydrogenase (short-subunit alcohol dehydrogenase family)